ncbi:GntR family transcriptional regulator [Microbacterium sp. NPDC079995]|uniref:GntR family transcriptional regulator n=1 Tax=unclassified Microbacterium TaxID=2609290 RepID=UPI00344F456F
MSGSIEGIRPAKRTGLADEVTSSIRQAIFDGVFAVGDRLGEVEIAHQLDVSRGPVREALMQLRNEGLVTIELHRGASVVRLGIDDIAELTSLRTTLEAFAIERATELATEEDLKAMHAVTVEMEAAIANGDLHQLSQMDIRFHDAIYAAARHERLTTAWHTIRSQMLLFLLTRANANHDYLAISLTEHRDLVEVIRRRDAAIAREMITTHVQGAYDRLRATMTDAADGTSG